MKAFTRVLTLTLVVILLALSLTACADKVEKGEYVLGDKAMTGCYDSYYFDGEEFSYSVYIQYVKQEALSYAGTYVLEVIEPTDEEQAQQDEENGITRGNITFTYTDAAGVAHTETKSIIMDSYEELIRVNDLVYTYYYEE